MNNLDMCKMCKHTREYHHDIELDNIDAGCLVIVDQKNSEYCTCNEFIE